jgi:hypothetical protein
MLILALDVVLVPEARLEPAIDGLARGRKRAPLDIGGRLLQSRWPEETMNHPRWVALP